MTRSVFVFILCLAYLVNSQRPRQLSYGQKYPNEAETNVCGRIRDVIPRDSGRFRKILIRNTNDDAQYENDDCRRMTARCKSKLDILASRVLEQWSSHVRVKVQQAWTDSVDPNDRASLHYEGRSVRLQTSDGDRGKLGRLAGLALEAGFDWVEYTSQTYIRASVIPDVCQTSVDLVFLLDGSGSVRASNFAKVKQFVKKVVDFFNIGRTGTHIAVVQFSTNTHIEFHLREHFTKSKMKGAVDSIRYRTGGTYTAEALRYLKRNIFTPKGGMRTDAGIPKVLVLLTDGRSYGDAVGPPAEDLKRSGISIFSIGVGSGISTQQLKEIASDPDSEYVFQRTFDDLIASWVDRLSAVSCSEGSVIDSCEKSSTSVESGSFKYFRTRFQVVTANKVSVELRDETGVSHLYASATSKNPGPLDQDSVKNEKDTSPKAVSVQVDSSNTVFVAVQGQRDTNTFSLSFWDNLFAKSTYNVTVKENEAPKQIITLEMAASERLKYKITDGNVGGAFTINSQQPRISTTKRLDRETIAKYDLVVVAESESNKCQKSRTNVVVTVGDENDNSPKFTEDPYRARILENVRVGTVVKTVKATDADAGINGQITYSISSATPANIFQINDQGQIILRQKVDYEKEESYTVNLVARDGGNKQDTSRLLLTVENVNEPPSISCNNVHCKYSVAENVAVGTRFSAKLNSKDPDTKTSCTLQYILPSSVKDTFKIASDGVISTNGALDRELKPQYVFRVTVKDCDGLTDNVVVTVNIDDVNDNSPQFLGPYTVDILESEQPGSNVVQVSARDADEGSNAEVRYSMSGSDSSSFKIDASTGRITTKSNLDYENKKVYSFEVTATDQGRAPRQGRTRVTVNVVDINDNKPEFGGPYTARVFENAKRSYHVITVNATDKDSGLRGEIRYSIVGGNVGDAFAVNSNDGQITVKSSLDRETRSSYTLTVQASDRGSPSLNARATVTITILDVNDNRPVFVGLPYAKSIPEDFSTSAVILKVRATDQDAGLFGQVSYSIGSPSLAQRTFRIDGQGNIHLRKALDYENTKDYTFTVVARDGGGLQTTENVKINVEDVNDNTPIFKGDPYSASVAENVDVGHVIGVVKATDADSGPRGRVAYSIIGGNNGNAFRINAAGSVSVASSLDRETQASYNLTIRAQDDGTTPKSSTAQFRVTVTDYNDNKPTFGQNSYSFSIAENNVENAVVGTPGLASDKDDGINAEIVYSITKGNQDGTFEFQDTGKLVAKKVLDRETIASYSLELEARDKGNPALSTRVPVEVTVEDENDNRPQFTQNPYDCRIDENSASNSRVCSVRATDTDIGKNGKVVYELVSPSSEFNVSQDNGEITTKVSLDREIKASYTLTIRAKDRGHTSLDSTVTVNVEVVDKNDNEPKFDEDSYSFDVSEGVRVNTKVGNVTASDADDASNGQVVYEITGGNIKSAFSINENNGDISVKSGLDRETLASYKLTIRASDRGKPPLRSSKVVPIKILDVNDNDPVFTQSVYSGRIAEDASVGSRVVQVTATDADEGKNSDIKYSITAGESKDNFTIDEDTGLITTAQNLDYESKKSYQLTVKATDQGLEPRSSTSTVNIQVKNTNDNAPTFVPGSPIVYVSEAVAIGTKVVQFNATDQDGNSLAFSISEGNTNDAFKIDKNSGLLTTKNKLDRETVARYNLTVTVTESVSGGKSTSQNLSVVVTDENDNAPVFDPAEYSKNIDENTPAGILLTVTATDKDAGVNAKISFSLDTASTAKFDINNNGVISTKAPLDHEDRSSYVITVTARDAGTPSYSSTASVRVTVKDLNDNKPRFKDDYTTTLRENTANGRIVLRVEASDPDSGANGEISYSITSGNDLGYFALNASDGIISVAKPPDRELNPSFTLNVRANNQIPFAPSTPTAKTNCTVRIAIQDVNDNAPVISNNRTTFKVVENSPPKTVVLDVDATDADLGENGKIEYEIVEGNRNNAFEIDRESGVIITKGAIDRETIDRYTLTVQASDKGSPRLDSKKDFIVEVTDVDDNAPVFNPKNYDVSVHESANLSTPVVRLLATDKDIGINAQIAFSIASGDDKDHFRIDPTNGTIYTKAQLDYEALREYNIVVEAKDTKHTTSANVVIRVTDINDNTPVFSPASYNISIPENQTLDTAILTVTATDADPFGGLVYTIDPPSTAFTLDPGTGELSAVSELDRETTDYYKLTVRATDGGTPPLSDTAFVGIRITDVNDNNPMFNSSQLYVSVLENSPVGEVLHNITATDKDIGVNAELRYRITGGNAADKFKLDAVSGVLTVNGNIDRESVSSYRLNVMSRDRGSPYRESTSLVVNVRVLDENDNSPVFAKDRYEQNITENLSAGIFVKEVEATDADIRENGRVTYAILSGAQGYFRIDNETGIIQTTRPLDREDVAVFVLTIEARDHGTPSRNATCIVQVNVLDANDNAPNLGTIRANVTEERPAGEFVTRIVARDPDQGMNAVVEYALTIHGNQSLKIDATTGVVTTRVKFDYEEKRQHIFKIIATDKGTSPLSIAADLIIDVLDIDDNCPVFNPKEYNVTIEENVAPRTNITRVYAKDVDTVGGNLDYGIRSGNIGNTFLILSDTGVLQSGYQSVDRELAAEFNLVVRAGSDYCGVNASESIDETIQNELSKSIAKVNIFVTDQNDNAPRFLQDSYEYELTDVYTSNLLRLNATDPDDGVNAEFDIGFAGVTRVESKRTLTVTATDRGVPSLTSNTTLDITGIKCEAMRFAVSARGDVTAKTLCRFDKVVVPESALVGQSARFNCSAQGNTVPEYRWYRDSIPVTDWMKTGEYAIDTLTKNDDGVYSCVASSDAGNILSEPHTFSVKEPAKITVHPEDVWVEVGRKANLSCRATGDRNIKYRWFKDDTPIQSSEDLNADQADLVFTEAILPDAALYYCKASNYPDAAAAKSRTARLEVYTPEAVVELEVTVDKPRHKEACQYFNMTNIEETIESMISGEMAVVEFEKPPLTCNLTACSSDPCLNGGRCRSTGSDFVCQCPRGWIGKRCQDDDNECETETCRNNGNCVNQQGSFSCKCQKSTRGKLCQFNDSTCAAKPCKQGKCYPKESTQGYECLADVTTVAMVFKLDESRTPFVDWMIFDVAKEIENAIIDAAVIQRREGGRNRRDAAPVDYSGCSVRVTKHKARGTELDLEIVLVCSQSPDQQYVCDAMLSQNKVTSCTDEKGERSPNPTTAPPTISPVRLTVVLITRDQEGEDMKASDAIRLLREGNIEDKLNKYSISDVVLRARTERLGDSGDRSSSISSSAIAGVIVGCVVLIVVGLVLAFLVMRTRHRRTGKDFSIGGRAILTRTQSSDAIIQRDIKMRELEHAEARGVNNKTFSEIYEEHDGRPHDLEDGSFMVDNPQIALRKHSQEYMRELESKPWFHGSITRSKAEDMLDASGNEGAFLVRSGLDVDEFYISVRTPNAEPKFRHIAVNRRDDDFVVTCDSDAEARNFSTFDKLVEHLRANPTHIEGVSEDVLLKEHVAKV